MEKLFSIIIPCYNAAEYIDRAMTSVIGQTVCRSLYEIIVVDDASTDDTLSCLNNWKNKYPETVKVITYSTNLRQGGARNKAIRQAVGQYICFLDADDWMDADALETFMVGTKENMDIVTAKYEENYEYPDNHTKEAHNTTSKACIETMFGHDDMRKYISTNLGYVWSSVYRRSIILENNVWFPEHLAYEDIYWQRLIKYYAQNACVVNMVTHHHYNHPGSTMNTRNAAHHLDRLTCYEMFLEEVRKRDLLEEYYGQILNDTMETYIYNSFYMFFMNMDDIPDVYGRIRETIYRYFPDWEKVYDDSDIPMVFQYLLKFIKKAKSARPEDLQPFKDAISELVSE